MTFNTERNFVSVNSETDPSGEAEESDMSKHRTS